MRAVVLTDCTTVETHTGNGTTITAKLPSGLVLTCSGASPGGVRAEIEATIAASGEQIPDGDA